MYAQPFCTVAVLALAMTAGCQTLDVHRPVQAQSAAPVTVNPDVTVRIAPEGVNNNAVTIPLGAGDRFGELLWRDDQRRRHAPDAVR